MGRVYARREDNDERFLVEIVCDGTRCEPTATIKPNADIANSGWTKRGQIRDGLHLDWVYCPDCS